MSFEMNVSASIDVAYRSNCPSSSDRYPLRCRKVYLCQYSTGPICSSTEQFRDHDRHVMFFSCSNWSSAANSWTRIINRWNSRRSTCLFWSAGSVTTRPRCWPSWPAWELIRHWRATTRRVIIGWIDSELPWASLSPLSGLTYDL